MEISPIAGIRVMQTLKAPPVDAGLTALFDIEAIGRTGDDRYSGGAKKAAGAEEDDEEELAPETDSELSADQAVDKSTSGISYFA